MKRKDYSELIGKTFGRLTVQYILPERIDNKAVAHCTCNCGSDKKTECDVAVFDLLYGKKKSCGNCGYSASVSGMSRYRDLTGQTFGYLTVIRDTGKRYANNVIWECECRSPNHPDVRKVEVRSCALLTGNTKSCGCYHIERASEANRIYANELEQHLERIFHGIKQRCYNPNAPKYYNYGKRGIYVCDEWLNDTKKFVDWAIQHGWKPGLEVDRYPDKNGPYAPWNCRIVDHPTNVNNKRTDRFIKIGDLEKTCAQWDRYFGLRKGTMIYRYHYYGKEAAEEYLMKRLRGEIK